MAYLMSNPIMETRRKQALKLHDQLESILKKALKDMERCAAQLESDNHYADAEYLHRRIRGQSQKERPYLRMPYKELKILAGKLFKKLFSTNPKVGTVTHHPSMRLRTLSASFLSSIRELYQWILVLN
jgi:hypothetical protein